jgi:hypothetical protein
MDSKTAKRNRRNGHGYERDIAKDYREAGFVDTITSRLGSLLHDSAKIDLTRLPFFPQCKYGYKSFSVNSYIELFNDMEEGIKTNKIPEDFPKIIHHRKGRKKNQDLVIIPRQDFFKLLKQIQND